MTTLNTWGNEYYYRLSQAMPPTPRPLPDDPGPLEARVYSRKELSFAFGSGYCAGIAMAVLTLWAFTTIKVYLP